MAQPLPEFDPEFADPAQWAAMYRACGWPVVPAWMPSELKPAERKNFKHPKITWRHYQTVPIPQADYDAWYASGGRHVSRPNMGTLTGGLRRLLMIDLDTYKSPKALAWWREVLETENHGIEPETVRQRSGGGGLQLFFQVPADWHCPNAVTDIGVDIRCDGGFAMLPPSLHDSGNSYAWEAGFAPWEVPVDVAAPWLLDAIESLIEAHGHEFRRGANGAASSAPSQTGSELNEWGKFWDHRERVMFHHVWRQVLEWAREPPGPRRPVPFPPDWEPRAQEAFAAYVRKIDPAAQGRERGWGLYRSKWRAAMRQWGSAKMIAAAEKPAPKSSGQTDDFGTSEEPKVDPETGETLPLLLSSAQFIAGFVPPYYIVDGILQRGYLYSLTARTNHGKTAVVMFWAQCVARAVEMHGREVTGGTVLFLAGENPQDIRARWLVLAETYGFDPKTIKVKFIDGVINIIEKMSVIVAESNLVDDLVLVIVDTAAAFFLGDDTNSNSQQGSYCRDLRRLTKLRGNPTVLVNCHPVKNAPRDGLLPMGGSAFLNEVDGNLTLWANAEKQTSLHWLGKFRGPEFEPIAFELVTATSPYAADAKGRLMSSVVAKPISDFSLESGERLQEDDENRLLFALHKSPKASLVFLANKCGFVLDGRPLKNKVDRGLKRLAEDKLITRHRRGYVLTKKGREEIGMDDENSD